MTRVLVLVPGSAWADRGALTAILLFSPLFLEYQVRGGKPDTFLEFISAAIPWSWGELRRFCDLTDFLEEFEEVGVAEVAGHGRAGEPREDTLAPCPRRDGIGGELQAVIAQVHGRKCTAGGQAKKSQQPGRS
jgi:hypothetical protein